MSHAPGVFCRACQGGGLEKAGTSVRSLSHPPAENVYPTPHTVFI